MGARSGRFHSRESTLGFRYRMVEAMSFITGTPGAPDPRGPPRGFRQRDLYEPDSHIETIKLKTRNFH